MAKEYNQPTDEQIRVRAYHLWETEGRPQNRDWEYWLKAKEQVEREISVSNVPARKPASALMPAETKKRSASRSPVMA